LTPGLYRYGPLFHPSTRTFRKALAVYRDAVGRIPEGASLFDAVLAMLGTVADIRIAQSCVLAILLVAMSCALVYYSVGATAKGEAKRALLRFAVYGAFAFAVVRLVGSTALLGYATDAFTLEAVLAAQKLALPLRAIAAFAAAPRVGAATRPEAHYLALQGAAIAAKASVALWDAPRDFAAVEGAEFAKLLESDPRGPTAILCGLTLLALLVSLRKQPPALCLYVGVGAAFTPFAEFMWADFGSPNALVGKITSLQLGLALCSMTLCGTPLLLFAGLVLNALVKLHGVEL